MTDLGIDADRLNEIREACADPDCVVIGVIPVRGLLAALDAAEQERDALKGRVLTSFHAEVEAREAAEARATKATNALREADDLLHRLSTWDHMQPPTSDGPFWLREIARARAVLADLAAEEKK